MSISFLVFMLPRPGELRRKKTNQEYRNFSDTTSTPKWLPKPLARVTIRLRFGHRRAFSNTRSSGTFFARRNFFASGARFFLKLSAEKYQSFRAEKIVKTVDAQRATKDAHCAAAAR
jgi:hypothetical protein